MTRLGDHQTILASFLTYKMSVDGKAQIVSRSQTFRLIAEGLGTMATLNGQGPPRRPYDWQVKQPITFRFVPCQLLKCLQFCVRYASDGPLEYSSDNLVLEKFDEKYEFILGSKDFQMQTYVTLWRTQEKKQMSPLLTHNPTSTEILT